MNVQPITDTSPAPHARETTDKEKLHRAISILQNAVLAADTALIPERIWGNSFMRDPAIEQAIEILIDVAGGLDE